MHLSNSKAVTLTSLTTANGPIIVNAAGTIIATDVVSSTDNSANPISLTASSGDIDAGTINGGPSAGGVTLTATNGSILDDTSALTGNTLNLTAKNGIGSSGTAINTIANNITGAVTAAGLMHLSNSKAVTLTSLTTANGPIIVNAAGTIIATDVVSSTDNSANPISLTASSGDIDAGTINGGPSAGGVTLTATNGSILDDASTLTGDVLSLTAANGIGTNSALHAVSNTISANTNNGNIAIDNNNAATSTLNSMTTGIGNILFSQSGGGALNVTTATTSDGDIGINVAGANLTATTITAGSFNHKVTLTTTGSGNMLLGAVSSGLGEIDASSAGAILDNNGSSDNLTALTAQLSSMGNIGSAIDPLKVLATTINATVSGGTSYIIAEALSQLDLDSDSPVGSINTPFAIPKGINSLLVNISGEENGVSALLTGAVPIGQINFLNVPPGLMLLNNSVIGGGPASSLQSARSLDQQQVLATPLPETSNLPTSGLDNMILAATPDINPDFILNMVPPVTAPSGTSNLPGATLTGNTNQTGPQQVSTPWGTGGGQQLLSGNTQQQGENGKFGLDLTNSGNGFILGNNVENIAQNAYGQYQNLMQQLPEIGQISTQQSILSNGQAGLSLTGSQFLNDQNINFDFSKVIPAQVTQAANNQDIEFGTSSFTDISKGYLSLGNDTKQTGNTQAVLDLSQIGKGMTGGSLGLKDPTGLNLWDGNDGSTPTILSIRNDTVQGGSSLNLGLGQLGLGNGGTGGTNGTDTGIDIGLDIGKDTGLDIGKDTGLDLGTDQGVDVGTDNGVDVGTDVGVDAGTDTGTDQGTDVGTEGPPGGGITSADLVSITLPVCGITVQVKYGQKPDLKANKSGVLFKSSNSSEIELEGANGQRLNVIVQDTHPQGQESNQNALSNKISCNGIDLQDDSQGAVLMLFKKEPGVILQKGAAPMYSSPEVEKDNSIIVNDAGQIQFEVSGIKNIVSSNRKWEKISPEVVIAQYSQMLNVPSVKGNGLADYVGFISKNTKE